MDERKMRNFAMLSVLVLFAVVVSVILFAKDKEKIYVSLDSYASADEESEITLNKKEILNIKTDELEEFSLLIPIPAEITDEDILVENDYQKHKMYITIHAVPESYYDSKYITAAEGYLAESYCEYRQEQAILEICLNNMYDNQVVYKNGTLQISFYKPKEFYERVILINIPELSEQESDVQILHPEMDEDITAEYTEVQSELEGKEKILLDVARKVKSLFSNSDTKVYLLGTRDEIISNEERIRFVEELKPDFVLSLSISEEKTGLEDGIATYYNEEYFIPFFGNEKLADYIEYYTLKETRANVLGISPLLEDEFLNALHMPAAKISIGFYSSSMEKALLEDEEYINKIVLGIYNGLVKSCENLNTIEGK